MLISICVPTYNRANLLSKCLSALESDVLNYASEVELVVSDNNSTDETYDVVSKYLNYENIKYHKNEINMGAAKNVIHLVNNLASGDYCWVIGDDDIVVNNGIQLVLSALKRNPMLDYFYVNYICSLSGEILNCSDSGCIDIDMCGNKNLSDGLIEKWESLIAEDGNFLTPIYCSVFRRERWIKNSKRMNLSSPLSNLDSTYPHTVILSRMMIGKPAWRVGLPLVNVFQNKSSWIEFVPMVTLKRVPELFRFYDQIGVSGKLTEGHKRKNSLHAAGLLCDALRGNFRFVGLSDWDITKLFFTYLLNGYFFKHFLLSVKSRLAIAFRRSRA